MSHVDIVPTVLDIIREDYGSVETGYDLDGRSVLGGRDPDEPVYAEVWIQNNIPDARIVHKKFENLKRLDIECRLGWRMLRTPRRKFIIAGEPEGLDMKDLLALDGEEFVRQLYLVILGRMPDPEGFANNLRFLQRGGSKEEVLRSFLNSVEKRQNPLYAMYDLEKDPFEEYPINPFEDPLDSNVYISALCRMMIISHRAVESEDIFSRKKEEVLAGAGTESDGRDEEETVMARLRDLGYME